MRQRRLFPLIFLACLFWLAWLYVLFAIDPNSQFSIFYFLLSIFGSLFFTLSLILKNTRRAFLISLGIVTFLVLRFLKLAHPLNLVLLLALLLTLEFSFLRR